MPKLQLTIQCDPTTGEFGMAGSPEIMGNQILAFGILEVAKQALIANAASKENRIVPASQLPPGFPGAN